MHPSLLLFTLLVHFVATRAAFDAETNKFGTQTFLAAMTADLGEDDVDMDDGGDDDFGSGGPIEFEQVANPENLVIIGQGPAGLSAAIYASRANLRPLVVARDAGQLAHPGAVENFPGCTWDASGSDIMASLKDQATSFGTRFLAADVRRVHLSSRPYYLELGDGAVVRFKALIVASGAGSRWLDVEGESKYFTKGVASCATCDGWFYRKKDVVVVGGGDTAMETALFMSRIAKSVTVLHRRDSFRASRVMADRVLRHPRIHVMWNTQVHEFAGDGEKLTHVVVRTSNGTTNGTGVESAEGPLALSELRVHGAFVAIGHRPNTAMFAADPGAGREAQLLLDEKGYILTRQGTHTATSVEGVFAAGDVADQVYRQAITSAGTGAMAALDAERHLCHLGC